jgi:hypothetical protein
MLQEAPSIDKESITPHFDKCSETLQRMRKLLNESTMFLPSYELGNSQKVHYVGDVILLLFSCLKVVLLSKINVICDYSLMTVVQTIEGFEQQLAQSKEKLIPRKKFAFSRKKEKTSDDAQVHISNVIFLTSYLFFINR